MYTFALDFDGVLCDSAHETALTGWKACHKQWPEIFNTEEDNKIIDHFRKVRPALKTGYESMILIYLLKEGKSIDTILEQYSALNEVFYAKTGVTSESLKNIFGKIRDSWIESDFESWLKANKFYPGVIEAVKKCPYPVYIITTKQKRFAEALCGFAGLNLPESHIFGLESGEKSGSLKKVYDDNPDNRLLFVEDRLKNLLDAKAEGIELHKFYADWGYGTAEDYQAAKKNEQITVISLSDFPQFILSPDQFLS